MQFTGSTPVSSAAPPPDDAHQPAGPEVGRERAPELPRHHDELPAGLLEALLDAPAIESHRLDRARAWLRLHHDQIDEVPTPDELADRILEATVATARR